jgi:hypothetical protein
MLRLFRRKISRAAPIPEDVRQLQFALTVCLSEIAIADAKWFYDTSLMMARRMTELGIRLQ